MEPFESNVHSAGASRVVWGLMIDEGGECECEFSADEVSSRLGPGAGEAGLSEAVGTPIRSALADCLEPGSLIARQSRYVKGLFGWPARIGVLMQSVQPGCGSTVWMQSD